jgi:biotin operon repressor
MSKRLNMLKPVLREKGIGVEDRRSNGRRLKKLFWL